MKNQNGITLIALVITIIVLLILAGVGIAMLSGDNGLLTQAKDASETQSVATAKEKVALAVNEGMAAYYDAKYVGNDADVDMRTVIAGKVDAISANLGTYDGKTTTVDMDESTGKITLTHFEKEYTATVDANGKLGVWTDPTE